MLAEDFAKVVTPLAWPVASLLIAAIFYRPVCAVLKRLAETLTFRTIKVKVLGVEAELTPGVDRPRSRRATNRLKSARWSLHFTCHQRVAKLNESG